jgi:hypothetical protein
MRQVLAVLVMLGTVHSAYAFDPLIGQVKQDPTREVGVYRVELARSKQDQLDRRQSLLDNADSMNQEFLYKAEPKENGKAMGAITQ